MYYPVTVNQALKRGQLIVNLPVMVIMFGGWALVAYLGAKEIIHPAFIFVGVFLSIILAYVYWSIMITHWRLWAFENVRNVHELKRRAIRGQLIWPDGSFFEKTEIRSSSQKSKWLLLQDRFKQKDIFEEDFTVPTETRIYFSKNNSIGLILISPLFLAAACFFYVEKQSWYYICLMPLVSVYLFITGYKQWKNRKPQIILSNEGIETVKTRFYTWGEVVNAEAQVEHNYLAHSATTYFKFHTPEGEKQIEINEFDINARNLDRLVILYKGRYDKKQLRK